MITLNSYKTLYKVRLQAYLKEYEDNTEDSFFEIELKKQTGYHSLLSGILKEIESYSHEQLKSKYFNSSLVYELKKVNAKAFTKMVVDEK